MKRIIDKASVLIEALPYIQKFRDEIIVIKFGGSAMEDPKIINRSGLGPKLKLEIRSTKYGNRSRLPNLTLEIQRMPIR